MSGFALGAYMLLFHSYGLVMWEIAAREKLFSDHRELKVRIHTSRFSPIWCLPSRLSHK
jgi:hypothetical protein